ncbi:hypothetical protein DN539_32250, partial [Burkholderia multivorans]
ANEASRSAVAAIAKATLKKDDEAEADAQQPSEVSESQPNRSERKSEGRSKSRGRKRSTKSERDAESTNDAKAGSTAEEAQPELPTESESESLAQ